VCEQSFVNGERSAEGRKTVTVPPLHRNVCGCSARQDTEILQQIADLAASGKLRIAIGRSVGLDQAIALISDLEAGRRAKGKAVIG